MNFYPHDALDQVKHVNFALDLPEAPLILLHGFTENHEVWDSVIEKLRETFWIIRPDLPGHGDSGFPEHIRSMEDMADWLMDFLRKVDIRKCYLAGHSMGGYLALAAAQKYPDFFEGVCLINSTPVQDTDEKKQNRNRVIDFVRNSGGAGFIETLIPSLFTESNRHAHPEWISASLNRALKTPDETIIRCQEIMMNRPEYMNVLADGKVPVSLILGAQDTLIPCEQTAGLIYQYTDAHLDVLHNSAHMSMVEEPHAVAQALSLYLHPRK